jgi:chitin disaccharide deacetylase
MIPDAPPAYRRVTVCADDFGLSEAASRAILDLGSAAAISATSVAVDGPAVQPNLPALRALRPRIGVGLHLNLTENAALPAERTLAGWILATNLRWTLDRAGLAREIHRQLDLFESVLGAPDFVDGHEHVHQFPVIRDLLLEALQTRYGQRVAVRCTWPRHFRGGKAAIIGLLGARALRREILRRGMPFNRDFAGVYDLLATKGYGDRMERWLRSIHDGGLLMCHPEQPLEGASAARVHEYNYLRSAEWPRLLRSSSIELSRFGA